jgi:hypothetical protein
VQTTKSRIVYICVLAFFRLSWAVQKINFLTAGQEVSEDFKMLVSVLI